MRHFYTKHEVSLDPEATGRFDQRRKAVQFMGLSSHGRVSRTGSGDGQLLCSSALASGRCFLMSSVPLLTGALPSSERADCSHSKNLQVDWGAFADSWRAGYGPAMNKVRSGELPWTDIDDLHRMILDDLLIEFGLDSLSDAEVITSTVPGTVCLLAGCGRRSESTEESIYHCDLIERQRGLVDQYGKACRIALGRGVFRRAGAALQARPEGVSESCGFAEFTARSGLDGRCTPRRLACGSTSRLKNGLCLPASRMGGRTDQRAECSGRV